MPTRVARAWGRAAAFVILVLVAGAGEVASAQRPEVPSLPSAINPRLDRITVAKVGPWTISATEFLLNYEFGPAFSKRARDSKKRHLNFMIYEKLLALGAKEQGLDNWPDVRRQTQEIEADLATEELYKQDVLGRVRVTDLEISRGVALERIHLKVRWLYAPTAEMIDTYRNALNAGVSFDSLFLGQFQNGVTLDDRTMQSTKFRMRTKNPAFAAILDTLPAGRVSLPVHGPDGWYLIQITDLWTNPICTESDEMTMRENVRRALTQHVADSLSDAYVQKLIAVRQATILREPFNAIETFVGRKFLDKGTFDDWKLAKRKGAGELQDSSALNQIASRTLVQMDKGNITVGQFLEWYRMREPYLKVSRKSEREFFLSVEELVWRMVRDWLLTERAYERGFQKRQSVRKQSEWWNQKMLYLAIKQRIGDTVMDSLPMLQRYYEENTRDFTDDQGNPKPFEIVRQDVWRQYYAAELTRKLLHEIVRLKQKYRVEIREKVLDTLAVDAENDPRAIDVYPVKKGGIYPRQAFPSIDYEWQTWN